MKHLKKFFLLSVLFLLSLQLFSEEIYYITESELKQIEQNTLETQEAMKNLQSNLKILTEQLEAQSTSLQKLENEKKLMIKISIPVVTVLVAGAFCGGIYAGLRVE